MAHILFHRFHDIGVPLQPFTADNGNPYSIPEARALKIIEDFCSRYDSVEISLDDGYKNAVDFLFKHHSRFPKVKWYVFICAKRVLEKSNHAWDHKWTDEFLLADQSLLREAAKLSRVSIGCHTNNHLELASLSDSELPKELFESFRDFEKVTKDFMQGDKVFAFPFGTPNVSYDFRVLKCLEEYTLEYRLFSTESLWSGIGEGGVFPRVGILDEACSDREKSWDWFNHLTKEKAFQVLK